MNTLTSLWTLIVAGSLRAGVLIAIVFALRWALRGRVPAQCFHWLWILVAIRLLLPVAPGSATSIYNLLTMEGSAPQPDAPAWMVREEPGAARAGAALQPSAERALPIASETSATRVAGNSTLSLAHLLSVGWLAGALLQVAFLSSSALRVRRALRQSSPVADPRILALAAECAERLGLRRPLVIRESSAFGGPALVGLWRQRLVLPPGLMERLSGDEARFVLLHECAHLRRRDLFAMWLLTAARVVHWFNPLAWLAVRAARIDTELACDETLLRHAGTTDAIAYGETLLKLTQLVSWRQPAIPIAAVTEGKGGIRLRLEGIASFTGHSTWQIAAALGILVGTSLVFAADETAKSVESANAPKTAAETEASAAGTVPEWAKDWSILHVIPPRDETDGAILVRAGGAGEKTLEKGKVSDSEPWLEKLELIATGDKRQWKATLRKGNEQAELLSVGSWSQQVEIHATFLETNETVIRRLRLKSKKGEGAGLRVLDDALRGRETNNVLTPAEGAELAATLANASGTHDLSGPTVLAGPRVTTRSGNRAVIEIIREFRYPTEWERDEQKQIWVPKAFETRNTGVTLEAEPLVTPQGAISITLTPQIVEFLGFKNLDTGKGLPRPEAKIGAPDPKQDARLARLFGPVLPMGNAQNPIWRCLPVFSARKLIVTPNLQSGEMVVCANLPETEDVAPFKSPAASTRVVVLVTARLIAPPPPAPTLKLGAPPSTPAPNYIPDPAIDEFLFGTAAEKRKAAKSSPPVVPANLQEKLPGFRAPGDAAGFVRSPYAPTAPAVDVRGFPPSTEVQCPTTGRVFVVPAR